MMNKSDRLFFDKEDPDNIREIIDTHDRFYFQYNNEDYLVEGFDVGYIIVEPFLYDDEGGFPTKTNAAYPGHLQAKTPEEFAALPFLDGKTLFERFDELKFFDV